MMVPCLPTQVGRHLHLLYLSAYEACVMQAAVLPPLSQTSSRFYSVDRYVKVVNAPLMPMSSVTSHRIRIARIAMFLC